MFVIETKHGDFIRTNIADPKKVLIFDYLYKNSEERYFQETGIIELKTLEELTNFSLQGVKRILKNLEKKRLVGEVLPRAKGCYKYMINLKRVEQMHNYQKSYSW